MFSRIILLAHHRSIPTASLLFNSPPWKPKKWGGSPALMPVWTLLYRQQPLNFSWAPSCHPTLLDGSCVPHNIHTSPTTLHPRAGLVGGVEEEDPWPGSHP